MGKFSLAVARFIPIGTAVTEQNLALDSAAGAVDDARSRAIECTVRAQEVFERIQLGLERGDAYETNPAAHSAVYDAPLLILKVRTAEDAFWTLARVLYGADAVKTLKRDIRGQYGAEDDARVAAGAS